MLYRRVKILIAIDSWKGCLTSFDANHAASDGVFWARWWNNVTCVSVSDGGEGFLQAFHGRKGWKRLVVDTLDPLMRPVKAEMMMKEDLAVIEMAQCCGLHLLSPEERNPMVASSYGLGLMMAEAVCRGAKKVVVGLGGSATSDSGEGMLRALENTIWPWLAGTQESHLSRPLKKSPRRGTMKRELGVTFSIATDVDCPLLGPDGATYMFARQKGATPEMLPLLEARAKEFADKSAWLCAHDRRNNPGAGAAGGVGYAMMQYLGAHRLSGADFVLNNVGLDQRLRAKDIGLIITGEGRADSQTLRGKLPYVILKKAQKRLIPVVLIAGQVEDREALIDAGFLDVVSVNPSGAPLKECMDPQVAKERIKDTVMTILNMDVMEILLRDFYYHYLW